METKYSDMMLIDISYAGVFTGLLALSRTMLLWLLTCFFDSGSSDLDNEGGSKLKACFTHMLKSSIAWKGNVFI